MVFGRWPVLSRRLRDVTLAHSWARSEMSSDSGRSSRTARGKLEHASPDKHFSVPPFGYLLFAPPAHSLLNEFIRMTTSETVIREDKVALLCGISAQNYEMTEFLFLELLHTVYVYIALLKMMNCPQGLGLLLDVL
jgi:hypothetical protein